MKNVLNTKKIATSLLAVAIILPLGQEVFAAEATPNQPGLVESVTPATPSLINGVPQSRFTPFAQYGPYFDSYNPTAAPTRIEQFQEIVRYTHDNSLNNQAFQMSASIQQSTSKGSEWYGEVAFSGEIKAGILGKIGTQVSGGVKETRSTNEAVGVSGGPLNVPAYQRGEIVFYYAGRTSGGTLNYKMYDDTIGGYLYYSKPVSVKVHPTILDVHSTARVY
ncbi:hypothetical protein [Paenibacillus qinlingensis]|uniref:hypothetical protein n=1 Tax=Paenibacillus qinlingensis TaxID=1837343 RepID=UPI001565BD36|nr:hypothetical protein [Paenibacillus qinlingensis]NQX57514.1 hypothetical protein [Paenibacillus qinlingensis]